MSRIHNLVYDKHLEWQIVSLKAELRDTLIEYNKEETIK